MKFLLFVGTILTLLAALPIQFIYAQEFTEDNFTVRKADRPAINEDFDPDESCLFDVYQVKCIPGSQQECPDNFGNNEDSTCFPFDENGEWTCPDDYHSTDDDESGQCYPNDEGCQAWILSYDPDNDSRFEFILLTDRPGESDRCADPSNLCGEDGDQPDHPKCDEYREWREENYN